VARPSRQQRRQRRAQGEAAAAASEASVTRRARQRQAQIRPGAQPAKQQTGRREPAPRGRFVREAWGELKKVEWPGRNQVVQGTVVVIIACAIVGAYLYAADLAFRNLVENVILQQG
jgi:preprotein translocase subunit SecE